MRLTGLCLALLFMSLTWAQEPKRQRAIDFEDEVIEGMNKRPLDSLSQIAERNKKDKRTHLYRKRAGFRGEIRETLDELRFIQ